MQIITGKIQSAQKVVLYGPEGIGKSTFASKFPDPLFIDTEGSTKHMDVARTPVPSSWAMLMEYAKYVRENPVVCKTLVIDTADWAEQLCAAEICARAQKRGIEDFGYGKGYVYLAEEFGRLINILEDIVRQGIHVVFTAHAKMRKFEQPDEMGAYDRWEMKLSKQVAPMIKEWADMVLFANYKTLVTTTENKKTKAIGGKRVLYTTHHVCWDAKNRHDLPDELPFDYQSIAHCILTGLPAAVKPAEQTTANPDTTDQQGASNTVPPQPPQKQIPQALLDLMQANDVTEQEIRQAVADRGYYPVHTPIDKYDPAFIDGVLVGAWPQVFDLIKDFRKVPF